MKICDYKNLEYKVVDHGVNNNEKYKSTLFSIPRSGTHYLMFLISIYFEKPTLPISYFFHENREFILYQLHWYFEYAKNPICLYRKDIISVIFSNLYFLHSDSDFDKYKEDICFIIDRYVGHMDAWYYERLGYNFRNKIIICYEDLVYDYENEFSKICTHFNVDFNFDRFKEIKDFLSKEEVAKRTESRNLSILRNSLDDNQYENKKEEFRQENFERIFNIICDKNKEYIIDIPGVLSKSKSP